MALTFKNGSKDRRKRIDNEKIDNYHIRAMIKLEEDDFESDFDRLLKRFQEKYANTECIAFTNNKTLCDCIKDFFYEILIEIEIADGKNIDYFYWNYNENKFKLESNIYLNGKTFNSTGTGTAIELDSILSLILEEAKNIYNSNPYICHYWEYKSKYLLPNSIDIETFKISPTDNLPLQNIFTLSNRENIKDEFTKAFTEDGDYENLLEQVSKKVTSTFQNIWQDFKETSIQLCPNGPEMSIKIVNKAKYSCEDRSDGFKKFISILLMLSTRALSNKIGERDIILIDEPDQSLYPTSARYLRDELLKIAEKAKIIYSTHSPYMIDTNCIDRHLIVEKKDDITTAKKQDEKAKFSNDELLRQAIGTSIFDILQDKNIIFEGWLDKELFNKYCRFYKKTNEFKNMGITYLHGISGVETLVQILDLANKKFIIVSDSDHASNNKRKDFDRNYKEFSQNWLSYADVVYNISTMEDFLDSKYISEYLKKEYPEYVYEESKNAMENIEFATKKDNEKKQKIKCDLMNNVVKTNIKEDYGKFINQLKEMLGKL
ncbi:MAG: ATP-binding protein [Fibromonadales bacterium]|nr:ATP-binding protein [Fibromonadales bacterium]